MSEAIITRFDKDNPCWTSELLELAGEDIEFLPELVSNGALKFMDGIYSLTESGVKEFNRAKTELFIDGEPGYPASDAFKSVARTKLRLLLDNAHLQRWGIKDYHTNVSLPIYPKLSREEIFSLKDGKVKWRYSESTIWKKIEKDFPSALIDDRRIDLVNPEMLAGWLEENSCEAGSFDIDLLYLCRYDFMQYKDFAGHPNDDMRLINTDRFLFVFPGPTIEDALENVGKLHIWLNGLRRMFIPGYVDRDTQEQDSVTWLVFTFETEREAIMLAEGLENIGEQLVKNANPCEVWTLSFEALEKSNEKRELIWELLPDIAHHAQRTLI